MTPARFISWTLRPVRVDLAYVPSVLVQRLCESVAAVGPRYEEQIVRAGGFKRGLDRVQPRIRDRAGRQPYIDIRIIRGVDVQVSQAQLGLPVAEPRDAGRVAPDGVLDCGVGLE